MNTLITFSGSAYNDTTALIVENGPKFGADLVLVFDDRWLLESGHYARHKDMWNWGLPGPKTQHRGFGWFSWKPYVILEALKHSSPDDVVLYIDADTYPIADLSVVFDIARRDGIMLFASNGWTNDQWVKRDCLEAMWAMDQWTMPFPHTVGRFCAFRRGQTHYGDWVNAHGLLQRWLHSSTDRRCTTFDPSLGVECSTFREHRCEQAILSVLQVKYGIRLYREACQFGDHIDMDKDLYPTLFHQVGSGKPKTTEGSRFRNVNWRGE